MRTALLLSAAFGLVLAAHPAQAQRSENSDSDARVVQRQSLRRASSAIESRDGKVALLLIDRRLVMQFTDHGLREIDRDMENDAKKEESGFARFVSGMVRGGVRTLLDRGIEYPVSELREARVEGGRLVLVNREGNRIFENVQINDMEVMESFDPAAARAFAARINQARRRADL